LAAGFLGHFDHDFLGGPLAAFSISGSFFW